MIDMFNNEIIGERGEQLGDEIFSNMITKDARFKNMSYGELMLAIDHMYAQMAANIYKAFKKGELQAHER